LIGIINTLIRGRSSHISSELPKKTSRNTKFIFKAHAPFKGKLKLTWYNYYSDTSTPNLHTGDSWQLLRLKLMKIVKIMAENTNHSSTVINSVFFSENSRIPKRKFKA
jgi:hypothetical protein